jgi:1,4-alpha-glucan branching enzyme
LAVAGRPAVLGTAPPADLFTDPPFTIRRPGAYEDQSELRFILHAPQVAAAALRGDWMPSGTELRMRSTRDGTYWWASSPVGSSVPMAYHGRSYRFFVDETTHVQDPAAGWVERSSPDASSRLVHSSAFAWTDAGWQTPDWDWLRLYQVHPARFSNRGGAGAPLDQVKWEVADPRGYLHQARFTALQLMPVNEIATTGWGYDPAFFYAIEESYGGPDALKRLVDACHRRGIAVLLDVVFNHAGTSDNSLWRLNARDFFDGDTAWGAMINFDEPAVRYFFEQNIAYLLREFHVDGFRFDFTRVIVHGHEGGEAHVRRPGSGGGWQFLHGIRGAARAVNPRCILIAEHLPNEWGVTNFGGPLDSQWCDDFHDRLKDASAGDLSVIGRLASACQLSQSACDDWFNVTNYAESHDEVGNENGRIAYVGGFGQGLRRAKVAGALTLLSRGIPLVFMGGEAGESRQFHSGSRDVLDIDRYLTSPEHAHVREWFNVLLDLRGNSNIKGPAPLGVVHAEGQLLAITRGHAGDFFMLANFGGWSGWRSLAELNLPWGSYRELWNSTWPAFAVENEGEHTNGGRDARLTRDSWLHVPDYGAVVLERV